MGEGSSHSPRNDACQLRVENFLLFLPIGREAQLLVQGQGARMVHGVGVHREALGRIAPGLLDGGVEQVAAEPAADAVRHEPEVGEVDGAAGAARLVAPVQLEVAGRSEEHTSELQSLMRISYAVFCLKTKQ